MKKLFTVVAAALMSLSAMAETYTCGIRIITAAEATPFRVEDVYCTQNDKGKFDISLKNFYFSEQIYVGDINLVDVDATEEDGELVLASKQIVPIFGGTLPVEVKVDGYLTDSDLILLLEIPDANTDVFVTSRGTQIPGGDFEEWHKATTSKGDKTSDEPNNWHSFMSCGGDYANIVGTVPHTFISEEVRPGSLGSKSVLVKSGKVLGFVVANGTLTTGRLQAGAMSATDPKNCSFSDLSLSAADANGDPFFADFKGMPDSLTVWVKFSQGTLQKDHPYATVNAVITDGTYYQDPEDKAYDNYLAKATCATIESKEASWQRLSIPFVYEEGKNLSPKAMHVTISTNADPGAGTGNDMLYVDDIALVYNCGISRLSVKGQDVAAKEGTNVYEAEVAGELIASDIEVTTDGKAAKADVRLEAMDGGVKAIVTVTAGDLKSNEYVLIAKGASLPAGISGIAAGSDRETLIYNVGGQRVGNVSGGLLIERNGNGVRKILTK